MWITIRYQTAAGEVGHRTNVYRLKEIMVRYGIMPEHITYIELDGEEYNPTPENIKIILDHTN